MTSSPTFVSPKQAARALGVSESSLKRWCDSGLINMIRTAGGHRKIAVGDVIRFANENGTSLVAPDEFLISTGRKTTSSQIEGSPVRLAEAVLRGNESAAKQILVDLFLANHPLSVLCDDVIAPAFAVIGDRWSCQSASVYQERRGCEIINWVLHELRNIIPPVRKGPVAIGGTIAGDQYEIPSAMVELVLRSLGYDAQKLGTSIPASDLAKAVRELRPHLFWLSVSHLADDARFTSDFSKLSAACLEVGSSLVVGGRALHHERRRRLTYSAHCDSMKQIEAFARDLKRWSSKSNPSEQDHAADRGKIRPTKQPMALKRKRTN